MVRHLLDHLGLEHAARRYAKENIRAADHISQRALVGFLGIDGLPFVHQRIAALVNEAIDIADPDVLALRAERHQQVETGDRRCARTGCNDLHVFKILAVDHQRVANSRADDDGGAVLIVVEDRNFHPRLQAILDLEALGPLDVLEVDAAEGRLERGHGLDNTIDGIGGDLDVEHIDTGELLEQNRLAFHHRLGRQRTDIAETQHGGAIADDGHKIGAGRKFGGLRRIGGDRFAGGGNTRRISQREVALVRQRLRRLNFQFTGPGKSVIGQRREAKFFGQIGRHTDSVS